MTPLTAVLLALAAPIVALTALAIGATLAAGRARHLAEQRATRIAKLRAELELARLEVAAARAPRIGLAAAARNTRTKPLPRFVRHDHPTLAREG